MRLIVWEIRQLPDNSSIPQTTSQNFFSSLQGHVAARPGLSTLTSEHGNIKAFVFPLLDVENNKDVEKVENNKEYSGTRADQSVL